jgi:hypothetical protein
MPVAPVLERPAKRPNPRGGRPFSPAARALDAHTSILAGGAYGLSQFPQTQLGRRIPRRLIGTAADTNIAVQEHGVASFLHRCRERAQRLVEFGQL